MKKAEQVEEEQSRSEARKRIALPLDYVERRIRIANPSTISRLTAPRRAAVAVILRFDRHAPDVLLMQRVARDGDRWSGHVSFPGGMHQPEDVDLLATAVRETREEVGLELERSARHVGRLSDLRAMSRGRALPMAITPYVFVQTVPEPLSLGDEAEEAFWLPLDLVLSGQLDDTYEYRLGPVTVPLKCWRYQGHVVWGLTHRMLTDFLGVIDGA